MMRRAEADSERVSLQLVGVYYPDGGADTNSPGLGSPDVRTCQGLTCCGQSTHAKSCGQSVGKGLLKRLRPPSRSFSSGLRRTRSPSTPSLTMRFLAQETPDHGRAHIRHGLKRAKRNEPDRNRLKRKSIRPKMAVTVGFEPTVGGYPTQLFESCTFGRSDTSPRKSLRHDARHRESAPTWPDSSQSSLRTTRCEMLMNGGDHHRPLAHG